jgi:hypothetical protein
MQMSTDYPPPPAAFDAVRGALGKWQRIPRAGCRQPGRTGDILPLSDVEVLVTSTAERSPRGGVQGRIAGRDGYESTAATHSPNRSSGTLPRRSDPGCGPRS